MTYAAVIGTEPGGSADLHGVKTQVRIAPPALDLKDR